MGVIVRDVVSVGASSTVENVIAGNTAASRYIRPPFNAIGRLLANVGTADLRAELIINGRTVMDDSNLRVQGANTVLDPLVDVMVPAFFVPAGSQMVLRSINPSAGAKELRYLIELEETDQQITDKPVTQRGPVSIAAGGKVQLLTGMKFERPRTDSYMDVFASASGAGLVIQVLVDGVSIVPPTPIQYSNRLPSNPGDLLASRIECPADKLIELLVENPTGGALNVFWRTELDEQAFL